MNEKRRIGIILAVLFLGGLIVWFGANNLFSPPLPPEERLSRIVASSADCKAPCWNGITPGETTQGDLRSLVAAAPEKFVDYSRSVYGSSETVGKLEWKGPPYGRPYISYAWTDLATDTRVHVPYLIGGAEDNVAYILFSQLQGEQLESVFVENILAVLGTPDAYEAAAPEGYGFSLYIRLFYEQKGIVVEFTTGDPPPGPHPWTTCQVTLEPDMPIRFLTLAEPDSAFRTLETIDPFFNPDTQVTKVWPDSNVLKLEPCGTFK